MIKRIKVFYITYSAIPVGPNSGVIRTQVYELLKGISTNCAISIYIRWICFVEKKQFEKNMREFKRLISNISDLNIHIIIVKIPSRVRLFKFLKGILLIDE